MSYGRVYTREDAEQALEIIRKELFNFGKGYKLQLVGSYRRGRDLLDDVDILVVVKSYTVLRKSNLIKIINQGEQQAKIEVKDPNLKNQWIKTDLFFCTKENYIPCLVTFTGSVIYNIYIRKTAKKKGLKVNRYGIFDGEKKIIVKTEKEFFKVLGIPYRSPKDRDK